MADSETQLFTFLIMFWTLLTIFSNVFQGYLEEPLSSDITGYIPKDTSAVDQQTGFFEWTWEDLTNAVYSVLDEIPVINVFVPLLKLLTFGYSDKIPGIISIFLNATMLFTYYIIWSIVKK